MTVENPQKMMKATNDKIIFRFLMDTTAKKFNETTESGLLVVEGREKQLEYSRWAEAVSIGPKVKDVQEGDYIIVQNLKWTNGTVVNEEKIWMTNEENVLAIANKDDPPSEVKVALEQ